MNKVKRKEISNECTKEEILTTIEAMLLEINNESGIVTSFSEGFNEGHNTYAISILYTV